jgi:hypothetical protein
MIGMVAKRQSDGVTSLSERANRCDPCRGNQQLHGLMLQLTPCFFPDT